MLHDSGSEPTVKVAKKKVGECKTKLRKKVAKKKISRKKFAKKKWRKNVAKTERRTQLSRALLLTQCSALARIAENKHDFNRIQQSFYLLNASAPLSVLFFLIIQQSVCHKKNSSYLCFRYCFVACRYSIVSSFQPPFLLF